MSFKILTVVGTRPNFIKVTQFAQHLNDESKGLQHRLVHTGQHYDTKMAQVFFEQFNLEPDFWLNVPPSSPNTQIAKIMIGLEEVIQTQYAADLILVVGDVNSTLAASLAAHKMNIPVAHVESGLRSFDRSMPEEINRMITDEISDYYFVTEQSGWDHLIKEGKQEDKMFFVGNTMIDTLVGFEPQIQASPIMETYGLTSGEFVLMTAHRPATVDHKEGLKRLLDVIRSITAKYPLVFPIHPRTLNRFEKFELEAELKSIDRLIITGPMDYFAFQKLIKESRYVLTDSGGIQEETTFRQVPCLTLRPNTERPATIDVGTNELVPFELDVLLERIAAIENGTYKVQSRIPKLWDGRATERIAEAITQKIMRQNDLSYARR
ncbi:MAG: UDP-N-acetylglucosamine 2-epimerase (non-hydrolyzing) [Bacteroidota bacterium]